MSASFHPAPVSVSAALRSFEAQWQARPRDALHSLRAAAMQRFLELGLPTPRDETWKYTNLRALAGKAYVAAPPKSRNEVEPNASLSLVADTERAATLLVINGYPILPIADNMISGFEINTTQEMLRLDPSAVLRLIEPLSDADQQRWALLNCALFADGLHLKITTKVSTPLVILHVAAGEGANNIGHPRVIIEALPGTSAIIIEHYVAQGEHTAFTNSNTRLVLGAGAKVEHYRVFATGAGATHMDSLDIHQARDSECKQFTIVLGGGLVRAALESRLNQPGASLESFALLVGHEERHVDCINIVTHAAPHTKSRQTARAIASDHSRVIFNSKVIVQAGAVHADSQQSCRGLLLSPTAEIDTRPQLEIHADEVKCAHGATVGRLDPDMLFYMLSRGLDRETAQSLLVYAFLADVLTGMSVGSARAAIENALILQLPDSQTLRKFR